ncbi:MAG: SigE family RNA polymerase sigma factor [Actinomycetota bacterium]|nr:SigE family RNA polymerase sigma factor [Actinomycetota bacterium]MDQ3628446.1 SigE family RNA polymerase sigma factor [Actinomycetota bacterium]
MTTHGGEDPVGFASYVDARRSAWWRTAWLLTADAHKAEDLVQTALLKVWPRWDRVVAEGDPDAYVRRTIYTTYVSWWRRRWNAEDPTEQLPEPSPRAQETEQRHDLAAALAQLPRGQRAVVVLRYFEDLTEVETARTLGCSVGSVKTQASRALVTLRSSPSLTWTDEWEAAP